MKLADINAIAGILAGLKINKMADPEAKDAVNGNYVAARRVMRPFTRDRDDLVEKFRSDWKKEISEIQAKKDGDYDAFYKAQADLNATLEKMLNEGNVDIAFVPVKADHFFAPDLWGEFATLGEIERDINFLIKHGVAEE